jgi:uncharacterized membrane protein
MKERLKRRLASLPRAYKRALMVTADVVLVPTALWLAFALKYDSFHHGLERYPGLYIGAAAASNAIFAMRDH